VIRCGVYRVSVGRRDRRGRVLERRLGIEFAGALVDAGAAWCISRYSSTRSESVVVARPPPGPIRSSTFRSAASASARLAKPPVCGRAEPRPSHSIAIGPERLPVGAFRLQLEHLAMLDHGNNLLDWCGSGSLRHLSA
jgi:hypothetical protein